MNPQWSSGEDDEREVDEVGRVNGGDDLGITAGEVAVAVGVEDDLHFQRSGSICSCSRRSSSKTGSSTHVPTTLLKSPLRAGLTETAVARVSIASCSVVLPWACAFSRSACSTSLGMSRRTKVMVLSYDARAAWGRRLGFTEARR